MADSRQDGSRGGKMGANGSSCCDKRHWEGKQTTEPKRSAPTTESPGQSDIKQKEKAQLFHASHDSNVGIGAYFQRSSSDPLGLEVKSLLKGSPAHLDGRIKVGDVVMAVEGQSTYNSGIAPLASLLLGPPGTAVRLTFRAKHTGKMYDVELVRGAPAPEVWA